MKKRKGASAAVLLAQRVNTELKSDVIGMASDPRFRIERVPIGSLTMERITGGGFARGRHVEVYGDYTAGKSYIAYRTMALAQQRGEVCAIIDAEKVFDEDWYRHLGGDPENLLYFRPMTAEDLIEVLMLFASTNEDNPGASIVTVDSVASLLPQEELSKRPTEGDDRTASRARMMSRLLRRVTTVNDDTLFIWTNQVIDKVGGYGGSTTPGGRALKFYSSARIEMRKLDRVKKPRKSVTKGKMVTKDMVTGHWVFIRAEKQKTSRPELESMFLFDYERKCIDPEYEIIHLGLEDGLIQRTGNTYAYEDSDGKMWSGLETKFRKYLRDEEPLREEIVWAIQENTRLKSNIEGGEDNGDPEDM